MFFHASQIGKIKILEPRIPNHNIPLIYFSDKRENVLVYLSNAVEKVCKEKHFKFSCNQITPYQKLNIKIPNAFISAQKTAVDNCEFIPDAYNEIVRAEANGLITILRYNEFISNIKRKEWLKKAIIDEYRNNRVHPDYRFFLESRFSSIINQDVTQ